jgi:uncharacterized membrane protein (UPF0127 family)
MSNKLIIGENELDTLLALTEEEHENGLMWVPEPAPIMTFVFNTVEPRKFWMRNTISPLDIIHCNDNKVISINQGIPMSEDFIGPDEPVNMVVEMPAGRASELGVRPGDKVNIFYSKQTRAKLLRNYMEKQGS